MLKYFRGKNLIFLILVIFLLLMIPKITGIIMLFFEIIATIYFSFYVKQLPGLNYPGGIVKTFFDIAMLPSFCVMCALFLIFKQIEIL